MREWEGGRGWEREREREREKERECFPICLVCESVCARARESVCVRERERLKTNTMQVAHYPSSIA